VAGEALWREMLPKWLASEWQMGLGPSSRRVFAASSPKRVGPRRRRQAANGEESAQRRRLGKVEEEREVLKSAHGEGEKVKEKAERWERGREEEKEQVEADLGEQGHELQAPTRGSEGECKRPSLGNYGRWEYTLPRQGGVLRRITDRRLCCLPSVL